MIYLCVSGKTSSFRRIFLLDRHANELEIDELTHLFAALGVIDLVGRIPRSGIAFVCEFHRRHCEDFIALYNDAVATLPDGVKFNVGAGDALAELLPSPKLATLVKKSRELGAAEADVGDA